MAKDCEFGQRIKDYEAEYTSKRLEGDWFVARIDGRSFSRFTYGMQKPYDTAMSWAMQKTTEELMGRTHGIIGYTQSDEITIAFDSTAWFGGKVQKLTSVLGGIATAAFMRYMMETTYDDHVREKLPHFDCRVFAVPSKTELVNSVLWRVHDCKKNAISSAAQEVFSHKVLQGKSGPEMIKMLRDNNIAFEDYPQFYRFGTTYYKTVHEETIPDKIWDLIPGDRKSEFRTFKRQRIESTDDEMTYFKLMQIIS